MTSFPACSRSNLPFSETPPSEYTLINVSEIDKFPEYPINFKILYRKRIETSNITTGNGKALSVMLRIKLVIGIDKPAMHLFKKFDIPTRDSIQLLPSFSD